MKDDKSNELSDYDIDKLIEEYSNISKEKKDAPTYSQHDDKKKFVVHIDESLIDMPDKTEDDTSKSASGGIYFSNYQKKHQSNNTNTKARYGETNPVTRRTPDRGNIARTPSSAQNSGKITGKKLNAIAAKQINRIGGKTAAAFLAFILVSTIVLTYFGLSCIGDMLAINRNEEVVSVSIPENATSSQIIDILQDAGLIKRKTFCKLFTKYRKFDDETYLSGVYYLEEDMGVEGMLTEIMAAPVTADTITLSFPEGWTVQQIFEKLEKYEVSSSNKLYTAAKTADFSYDFLDAVTDSTDRYLKLEGYMFPDTYDFYVDADTNYVIKKFLENFDNKWTDEYNAKAQKMGYTMDQIITIASIIQKEAADSTQMKTIASILYNRLSDPANYPTLGCDSTAIYISNYVTPIVGEAQGNSYYTKYDTSAIKGLPPGPICNPGIDAIKAALYPEETNYYFFAHDDSGKIYLAETYKEHRNNLVKIIKANNSD